MPLQIRRGNDAERQTITPAVGELIYVTDTKVIYIGDGTTQGGVPVINYSTGTIKDLAAEIFADGSHIGINFTYDEATDKITAIVDPDLTDYQGTITASAFKGSFFADDSTRLLNGIDGSINLDQTITGNIVPRTDASSDLGTSVNRIRDGWFSRDLNVGNARIEAVGTVINLPVGSTVAGVLIGSGSGTGEGVVEGGNYRINVIGSDSTIMVNSEFNYFQGDLIGSIQGNVFASDSSLVLDADTGTLFGTLRGTVLADDGSVMYDPNLREINALSIKANVLSTVGNLLVDHFTDTHYGSFVGNLRGDLRGSVFGDDSSMLIDGTNSIVGNPNGFTIFENSNIRINAGGNIIGKKTFNPALDPTVEIGSATEPSSVILYSNKKSFQIFGSNNDGFTVPDVEFYISRGTTASPAIVSSGDAAPAIRWSAHDGSNYEFVVQANVVIDPRSTPSLGDIKGVFLLDFPQDTNPGDRSFIFDADGKFYSPVSVNTTIQGFGSIDTSDPTLFTELHEITVVNVDYIQLVNNAAENVQIFTYPVSDYVGGKLTLSVERGTDIRLEEHLIFNNSSSVNSAAGTAGGIGTNPVGALGVTFSTGNVIVSMTTDTNNLAGDTVKIKAKFELFTTV